MEEKGNFPWEKEWKSLEFNLVKIETDKGITGSVKPLVIQVGKQ